MKRREHCAQQRVRRDGVIAKVQKWLFDNDLFLCTQTMQHLT